MLDLLQVSPLRPWVILAPVSPYLTPESSKLVRQRRNSTVSSVVRNSQRTLIYSNISGHTLVRNHSSVLYVDEHLHRSLM